MEEALKENETAQIIALRQQAARLPHSPGVYIMRDTASDVIYVGKAKDLRNRVKTYFLGGDGRAQIEFLLKRISHLETIVTDSENQAFVLERDLITKYKPRYNIRLKDDKAYLSIRIDKNQPWPRLELVRKVEQDGARYFGPYSFSYELRNLLEIIKRAVPLRSCSDTVFHNRARPCLEYQIKRCAGPCCLPVDREQYMEWVKQAMAILEGRGDSLIKDMEAQMAKASEEMRFEDAALLRDRITTLQNAKGSYAYVSHSGEDRDCFNLYREEGLVALSVIRVRNGRLAENVNFSFQQAYIPDEEIIESAVEQFYEGGREVPEEIISPVQLSNQTIIEDVLSEKRGAKCGIIVPERGVKARLLGLAALNARQYFSSTYDAEMRREELSKELARMFKLRQMPRRIECLDISNLQGSDIVGAVVSFYDGEPDKNSYRRYNISFQDKPDDFAAVQEVVERRVKRGLEKDDFPDLLVIDGGPPQLRKALKARDDAGVTLDIVALAKERMTYRGKRRADGTPIKQERVYTEGSEEPVVLAEGNATTHLLQRIRDEAHRFVILFHREKRGKRATRSALDEISGLGPERRRRLLKTFGTVEGVRNAPAEEVAKAGRMPLPLALKVKEKLSK